MNDPVVEFYETLEAGENRYSIKKSDVYSIHTLLYAKFPNLVSNEELSGLAY